jgi:serine/threonine protein kinase
LVDFGLSKAFTADNPFMQTTCDSPGSVAPEIVQEKPYTAAADIWSAGILLYAMFTGNLPFTGDSIAQQLNRIVTAQVVIAPHLSPELTDRLHHLLMKDPASRPTIRPILKHPWLSEFMLTGLVSDDQKIPRQLKIQDGESPSETDSIPGPWTMSGFWATMCVGC